MNLPIIYILITLITNTISQRCVPSERSPNNPSKANCNKGFFDLILDPTNQCICCTETGIPDDNPPDECLNAAIPTPNKTAIGTLICNENFDCCQCMGLECIACVALQCSGDSACIGVKPIKIDGACELGGATLQCNGDVACFRTEVYGECVTAIDCNGDNSCGETSMELNLNRPVPDTLRPIFFIFNGDRSVPRSFIKAKNVAGFTCGGDESCAMTTIDLVCRTYIDNDKGCKLEVGGDNAAPKSVWKVIGADFVSCKGDNSCGDSKWDIKCVERKGCPVTLTGDNSAPRTMFKIRNANQLSCAGDESCIKSIFDVTCNNPRLGCAVTITGELAAQRAKWTVVNANRFKCVGINACTYGEFVLDCIDKACSIECSGSCKNTMFHVKNSNGVICNGAITNTAGRVIGGACENAVFRLNDNKNMKILCDGVKSCENARFSSALGGPVSNVGNIGCTAEKSCFGTTLNVIPASSAFALSCNGMESCRLADIDIELTRQVIKAINCNGPRSCEAATIDLERPSNGNLRLELFGCTGSQSCQDAIINVLGNRNIEFSNFQCNAMGSCRRADLNINLTGNSRFISTVICGGMNSCVNFNIEVKRNGVIAPPNRYIIQVIGCQVVANCRGATINGRPFSEFLLS